MILSGCAMLLPGRRVGYGDLEVEGDRIVRVDADARPPEDCARLVLPGLVNCHAHAPMTLMRGVGGGLPLQSWLEEAIFPVEAKMTEEDVRAGMAWGVLEMLAGGTVAVADMYEHPHACGETLRAFGMKGRVCCVGRLSAPGRLAESEASCREWNARADGADVLEDACVHSEYLVDEAYCRGLAAANRSLRRPLHFHCSETLAEHEACLARHGCTPIAYFDSVGLLEFGGYAAHCVWCTDDDFRLMARRGVTLVHNPTSNMKLGSGFARVPRAIELGVNVALGTDGCASNDNLDLFEEMHLASLIHKGLSRDPRTLSPWDVIEMATRNGARALGLADSGELAVGRKADLCVVDLDRPHLVPALDLPNLVVHAMHASDVAMTLVDGRVAYARDSAAVAAVRARAKVDLLAAVRRLSPGTGA